MFVNFLALDKNSSASMQEQVVLETESLEVLKAKWADFTSRIPFTRWYSDNTVNGESASAEFVQAVEELA